MRFIRNILRSLPLEQGSYGLALKSTVLRIDGKTAPKPYPWKYQLKLFLSITRLLLTLPFRMRSGKGLQALYYDQVQGPEGMAQRRYFLRKYAGLGGEDSQIQTFAVQGDFPKVYVNGMGPSKLWQLHRLAWRLFWAAFCDLFKPSRVHWYWKFQFANSVVQQVLFHAPGKQQFLFFSYEAHTYLSALVASHLLSDYQPVIVASNSILFRDNRYNYNPRAHLKLCSRVQEAETHHYQNLGWMRFKSVTLWGLEESKVIDALPPTQPRYDIGIYSSGCWARTKDFWRAEDLNAVRAYKYIDNPMYLYFLPIMQEVIALKHALGLKVKVYFHPFEARLFYKDGIRPPYIDLLEANGVDYEVEGKSSLDNFYESRIAVSVSSTIIFDRLHYGLPAYYYAGDGIPRYTIADQYIGRFRDYRFVDLKEMRAKLVAALGAQ